MSTVVERAFGYDPTKTSPANAPSFAREDRDNRTVTLTHPSGNIAHPSVVAAIARYRAKWFTVTWGGAA